MQKKQSIHINAILNVIKQCCVIIFPLITYSYISRVLGSGNLGRYSFSDSMIQYFIAIASLGVPTYAIREAARMRSDKKKIQKLVNEIFSINVVMTIIALIILFLLEKFIPRLNREAVLISILSMEVVSGTIGRDWINNVYEDFFYLTLRYILIQVVSLILIFLFIKSSDDYIKYTWIMAFSYSFNYILNIFYTGKRIPYGFTFHLNLKTHLKPIIYLFCIQIANIIFVKSDILILGFFRPDSEVGIYTIASNIYVALKTLLNAVIIVAIPRLSVYLGKNDRESYMKLLNGLRNILYTSVIPCVIGVFFLSQDIMFILGGKNFIVGAQSLQILCIAIFCSVFGSFYNQAILVPNRDERHYFYVTIISAMINIVLNLILIPRWGINAAAFTTVLAEGAMVVFCKKYSYVYTDSFKKIRAIPIVVGCFCIAIICMLCQKYVHLFFTRVIFSILFSIIAYAIVLLIGKNEVALNGLEMIQKKLK